MLHLLPHSIIGALLSFFQESVDAQSITAIIHPIPPYSPVILPDIYYNAILAAALHHRSFTFFPSGEC